MYKQTLLLLAILLVLVGCGGVRIIPHPDSPGEINTQNLTISQTNEQITITAKVMDLEIRPSRMDNNICSFLLVVKNGSGKRIDFSAQQFTLADSKGNQYRSISPEKVREIVAEHDPYLIPYPYVGYYYLGDVARGRNRNDSSSMVTYFPTRNPQTIELEALPDSELKPNNQVSGLLYFLADLRTMEGFTLEGAVLLFGDVLSSDFRFPFSVVKK